MHTPKLDGPPASFRTTPHPSRVQEPFFGGKEPDTPAPGSPHRATPGSRPRGFAGFFPPEDSEFLNECSNLVEMFLVPAFKIFLTIWGHAYSKHSN